MLAERELLSWIPDLYADKKQTATRDELDRLENYDG
jgi:hypothetical protein